MGSVIFHWKEQPEIRKGETNQVRENAELAAPFAGLIRQMVAVRKWKPFDPLISERQVHRRSVNCRRKNRILDWLQITPGTATGDFTNITAPVFLLFFFFFSFFFSFFKVVLWWVSFLFFSRLTSLRTYNFRLPPTTRTSTGAFYFLLIFLFFVKLKQISVNFFCTVFTNLELAT